MIRLSNTRYHLAFLPIRLPRRRLASVTRRALLLVVGAALAAFGFAVFQVPYNLAAGGIGSVSLIIHNIMGWPVGVMYFLLNIPLLAFGSKHLGRWPFLARTVVAAALFATFTDLFGIMMPRILDPFPPTADILLSAIYGA